METLTSIAAMKQWSRSQLAKGESIGFVPTMGYLHEGHVSLLHRGRSENRKLVASIFVNPTQFGPQEDLASYPKAPEADALTCEEAGVDALFLPTAAAMYGPDFHTYVDVERISEPLCGESRQGHFRGVATVVLKLFNIVRPSAAYFGMKDYQQLQVIKTMVKELDLDVRIVPCPTMREDDGLAMSSRNSYLSPEERRQAVCLFQALEHARLLFEGGEREAARYVSTMSEWITREPDARPVYVSLVHPETLVDLTEVKNSCLAALAVRIGKTRLIDNMLFERTETGTGRR